VKPFRTIDAHAPISLATQKGATAAAGCTADRIHPARMESCSAAMGAARGCTASKSSGRAAILSEATDAANSHNVGC